MGALYLGGRKGEREVPPPSLCFYKVSLDTLRADVFTVFAESSDLCLSAAEVRVQMIFFSSISTDPAKIMAWLTQVSYLGSKPVSFPFFSQKHTHTLSLYLLITEMLTYLLPSRIAPSLSRHHRGTKQMHCVNHY